MCGIAGIIDFHGRVPPERAALEQMLGALSHRGPDEFGLYRDRRAGLAHNRLSIIDRASGQQPLCNQDQTLWIVFNGEIFNYLELRDELSGRGHRFRTQSDTEVIVHAWEEWGADALARMNGQWAIALWDARRHRLALSRDRLGVRPLYYSEQAGRLVFASEVKAMFAGEPSLPREIDPIGLDDLFTLWSVIPPRSVFRGIAELEPGHVRIYDQDGLVEDRAYWTPSYPEGEDGHFAGSIGEASEAVRASLERATSLRMLRSDVPVGSYLSGGLDSSLVSALALAAKGERFHTFAIRFEEAEYDETAYQRLMVGRIGSEHHELVATQEEIALAFPEVIYHTERPILDTAPAPLFLLSRVVHDIGIKVVLTGEGADEMFGGYELFREGIVRRFWAREPRSRLRPLLLERLYPHLARSPAEQKAVARQLFGCDLHAWREPGFAHRPRWRSTSALKRLLTPAMRQVAGERDVAADLLGSLPSGFSRWSHLAQDQFLELRTLLAGYLLSSQGDRMLMANSVEGRFPFLDHEVMELASTLPDRYKVRGLNEKHVLKRAAAGLVPEAIIRRPKQPYRAPDARAFLGDRRPGWIGDVLADESIRSAGIFDPGAVTELWQRCSARGDGTLPSADNMALVAVLSTQLLHEFFIRRPPASSPPPLIKTAVEREEA